MVRAEPEQDITSFKYRYPGLGSVVGNAAIGGKRREIQQLSRATCTKPDKTLERLQFLYLQNLTNVPLNISRHIGAKPFARGDLSIIKRWISSLRQHLIQTLRRHAGSQQFIKGKGEQLDKSCSSCQGLTYVGQKSELLRSS